MMLRTQTTLAVSGAVVLTAIVLWLIGDVQLDSTTLLRWSIALSGLLAASFVLSHILMRPLAAMSKSARAFADDGNSPAPVSSDSEVGLFVRALNRMAADVRCKSEALSEETSRRRNTSVPLSP
jgi:methyl-accepting chemotaxis protein